MYTSLAELCCASICKHETDDVTANLVVKSNQNDFYDEVQCNKCYDEAGCNSCYDKAGLNSCYNEAGLNNLLLTYHETGDEGVPVVRDCHRKTAEMSPQNCVPLVS